MNLKLTKYLTLGDIYVVRVTGDGPGTYRASTNDFDSFTQTGFWYDHIEALPYRDTEEEAQQDLDGLATKLNLKIAGDK